MSATSPAADPNLLFGLLALQTNFVTRDQLLDALTVWSAQRHVPLGELLRLRGIIDDEERLALGRLLNKYVKRHGGDVRRGLTSLPLDAAVRAALAQAGGDSTSLISGQSDPYATAAPIPVASSPTHGRFRRLHSHARGGLGEVFFAQDEELRREVALKEIRACYADDPGLRARFVREAEITGHLEHPGVVPVYGLGAYPDGRPYYAMRFIRGEPMSDAIRRFHKADLDARRDPDERARSLRDLLTRFVALCNAVAYAHSRGVIHRDLKPANVMLGEYGETLLVDWGLARAYARPDPYSTTAERQVPVTQDDAARTEYGQVVGTPAYLPPEQAQGGEVTPASDVWALGAILYEILTGRAPHAAADAAEAQERARRGDVTPARQRNPKVPRALEAVCSKAMAVLPAGRYGSARELADEVERWLGDEPVRAYSEPLADRARRWGRRHRTLATTGVALLLVGVLGLAAGLGLLERERSHTAAQRNRAVAAEEKERERAAEAEGNLARALLAEAEAKFNLKRAEQNLDLARQVIDETYTLTTTHPAFQEARMRPVRRAMLETTLPFYRDLRAQKPDDAELMRQEAEKWFRVAYIEQTLMRLKEARDAYAKSLELHQALAKTYPKEPTHRLAQATIHGNLGQLLTEVGQNKEALREYERGRDLAAELVKERPREHTYRDTLASIHGNLAILYGSEGRNKEAQAEYGKARDLLLAMIEEDPRSTNHRESLALNHCNLGVLLTNSGKHDEAIKELRQAQEIQSAVVKRYPRSTPAQSRLIRTLNNLGDVLLSMGKLKESAEEYAQARDMGQKLVSELPDVPTHRCELADTYLGLGGLLAEQGKRDDALDEYARARDLAAKLTEQYPAIIEYADLLTRTSSARVTLLARAGRLEAALNESNDLLEQAKRLVSRNRNHPIQASLLTSALPQRAAVLTRLGKKDEADPLWAEIIKLTKPSRRAGIRLLRADARARAGDYLRSAEEAAELDRDETLNARGHFVLARIHAVNAAQAARDVTQPKQGRDKRADEYAVRAVALLKRAADGGNFRNPKQVELLDNDGDLDALRQRDDYRAFRKALKP